MNVLLSGGGTAGHIYPALSVAAALAAAHDAVTFVGTPDGLEARLVPQAGVEFVGLPASGFDRARPATFVSGVVRAIVSAARAWTMMGSNRPDVVIGFGGYVSVPVAIAARLRGVPLVLHEQNSVPGLANRVCSRWAKSVAVTYEESAAYLAHPMRAVVTGNPVREAVLGHDRASGRVALGLPEDAVVLLVFGGSRGARHINSAVVAMRDRLLAIDGVYVVHVAGPAEANSVRAALDSASDDVERYRVLDYLDDMGAAIAAADLVVARAGATSIAELTALGAACVLVPYPYATDDHQTKNAAAMAQHGAAVVVADPELDSERFADEVAALLADAPRRATMSAASRALGMTDAAQRVADLAHAATSGSDSEK